MKCPTTSTKALPRYQGSRFSNSRGAEVVQDFMLPDEVEGNPSSQQEAAKPVDHTVQRSYVLDHLRVGDVEAVLKVYSMLGFTCCSA